MAFALQSVIWPFAFMVFLGTGGTLVCPGGSLAAPLEAPGRPVRGKAGSPAGLNGAGLELGNTRGISNLWKTGQVLYRNTRML